jgi:hypothetical protein
MHDPSITHARGDKVVPFAGLYPEFALINHRYVLYFCDLLVFRHPPIEAETAYSFDYHGEAFQP